MAELRNDDGVGGLTGKIIGAAITVHRYLGPGLLESAYEACLVEELRVAGIATERQVPVPLTYRGIQLECGYRIDVLVERKVIVELKVVAALNKVHVAQVLTHLRLRNLTVLRALRVPSSPSWQGSSGCSEPYPTG